MIVIEDLTREVAAKSRCICATDGLATLPVWENPDDKAGVGQCQMVYLDEIRALPVARLVTHIQGLGWKDGFSAHRPTVKLPRAIP